MKSFLIICSFVSSAILLSLSPTLKPAPQEFQGQAVYFSKSTMQLGSWGARMSEAQKKQVQARLKNRLEKTYTLNFNKEASVFDEEEKLDAMSGATDSWGQNFAAGEQFKNVKENQLVQSQELYGKQFLVKDELIPIDWVMGKESKQIGQYMCFKATASVPTADLTWYSFAWSDLRRNTEASEDGEPEVAMTQVEAWYTPQIPVRHGPGQFWGLPGLILEVSAGDTTMLCSKITLNPSESIDIEAPKKGKEITKKKYKETITEKMMEMRNNRGRRRS
ncbi:MAG: GLPGLI family protein [Dokdonia sp.]